MEIRYATPADVDALTALEAACFPPAEAAGRERFAARVAAFPDCFWLLWDGEDLVACVDGGRSSRADLTDEMFADAALHEPRGPWQMLYGVQTHPARQGSGCASQLMRRMIADSRARGCRGVVLTCKEALRPFYARFGFADEGVSASDHGGARWYQMRLTF